MSVSLIHLTAECCSGPQGSDPSVARINSPPEPPESDFTPHVFWCRLKMFNIVLSSVWENGIGLFFYWPLYCCTDLATLLEVCSMMKSCCDIILNLQRWMRHRPVVDWFVESNHSLRLSTYKEGCTLASYELCQVLCGGQTPIRLWTNSHWSASHLRAIWDHRVSSSDVALAGDENKHKFYPPKADCRQISKERFTAVNEPGLPAFHTIFFWITVATSDITSVAIRRMLSWWISGGF